VIHRSSSAPAAAVWKHAAAGTGPGLPSVLLRDPRPDGPLGQLIGLASAAGPTWIAATTPHSGTGVFQP